MLLCMSFSHVFCVISIRAEMILSNLSATIVSIHQPKVCVLSLLIIFRCDLLTGELEINTFSSQSLIKGEIRRVLKLKFTIVLFSMG